MTVQWQLTFEEYTEYLSHVTARMQASFGKRSRGRGWVTTMVMTAVVVVLLVIGSAVRGTLSAVRASSMVFVLPWALYFINQVCFAYAQRISHRQSLLLGLILLSINLAVGVTLVKTQVIDEGYRVDFVILFPWIMALTLVGQIFMQNGETRHRAVWEGQWRLQEPTTLTLDDAALVLVTPTLRTEMQWTAITKVVQTPKLVLLMTGDFEGLPVPKRSFDGAASVDAFVAAIGSRIPSRTGGFPVVPAGVAGTEPG